MNRPPWKNRDWLAHGGPAPEPGNVPFAERSVAVPSYEETYLLGTSPSCVWNVGVTVYPEGLDGEPFHVTIVRVETDESSPPAARTAAAKAALLIPRERLGRGFTRFTYRGEADAPVPANPFNEEPPANPFNEEPPDDRQMREFIEREMKAKENATKLNVPMLDDDYLDHVGHCLGWAGLDDDV